MLQKRHIVNMKYADCNENFVTPKINPDDTFSLQEKDTYFLRNWRDYLCSKRGKLFCEIDTNRDYVYLRYLRIDCYSCVDFNCKGRKHRYKQPLSFTKDSFWSCSLVRLLYPSEEEKQRRYLAQQRIEKAALKREQQRMKELKEKFNQWLNRQEPEVYQDYIQAVCEVR